MKLKKRALLFLCSRLSKIFPNWLWFDILYAKIRYYATFNRLLDLKNPRSFNEKIQYIKLFDRKKIQTKMADKYKVREYVKEKIGDEYLIPLLGVYDNPEDIDINKLPDSFVLKVNHGSGYNIICKNKNEIDFDKEKIKLSKWLSEDYYKKGREWVYKDIDRKIVCEKFIESDDGRDLLDYKFFCFNGKPEFVQVDIDRFSDHTRNIYSTEWKKQNFSICYPQSNEEVDNPIDFNEMLEIVKKLAYDQNFIRIDLYTASGKIFFGELTHYPGNGFEHFFPDAKDFEVGKMLAI